VVTIIKKYGKWKFDVKSGIKVITIFRIFPIIKINNNKIYILLNEILPKNEKFVDLGRDCLFSHKRIK